MCRQSFAAKVAPEVEVNRSKLAVQDGVDLLPSQELHDDFDLEESGGPRLDASPLRTPVVDHAAPRTPPRTRKFASNPNILDSEAFLPAALTIPGLQHLANNMCNETHTALEHWKHFWNQLKAIETLLALHERRTRFVWTCLRGTPFASKVFAGVFGGCRSRGSILDLQLGHY
jgi:hypothetical protein